jgi:hypothetical protein
MLLITNDLSSKHVSSSVFWRLNQHRSQEPEHFPLQASKVDSDDDEHFDGVKSRKAGRRTTMEITVDEARKFEEDGPLNKRLRSEEGLPNTQLPSKEMEPPPSPS